MNPMDFEGAARLAQYIAKDYSREVFRLLMSYQDISASEAASRLNMHIRTLQEYLDVMAEYNIIGKREVIEGKRPYYRYHLKTNIISIQIDLDRLYHAEEPSTKKQIRIRERKNSGVRFTMARQGDWFSTLTLFSGKQRAGKYKRINLTTAQGKFLYNLPFPDAMALSVEDILELAGLSESYRSEVENLVNDLIGMQVIEAVEG